MYSTTVDGKACSGTWAMPTLVIANFYNNKNDDMRTYFPSKTTSHIKEIVLEVA